MPDGPAHGRDAVIEQRRTRVLGRQRILDAQATQPRLFRDLASEAVITVDRAEDPATTAQENDGGRGRGRARVIEADPRAPAWDPDPPLPIYGSGGAPAFR